MLITALQVTLFFASLGLAVALLTALHDFVEAKLQQRSNSALRGAGGLPAPGAAPRRAARRMVPAPLTVVTKPQAPEGQVTDQGSRPVWLENAQRDVARH
ncbi:MAG: hypothetical protein WDA03_04325 [Trueperaceae bacterium]